MMKRKARIAIGIGAASVAAWATSKAIIKKEPRADLPIFKKYTWVKLTNRQNSDHSEGQLLSVALSADEKVIAFLSTTQEEKEQLLQKIHGQTKEQLLNEQLSSIICLEQIAQSPTEQLLILSIAEQPVSLEGSLIPSKLWALIESLGIENRVVVQSDYSEQINRFNLYAQNKVAIAAPSDESIKAISAYTSTLGHLYKPTADVIHMKAPSGPLQIVQFGFIHFLQKLNVNVIISGLDEKKREQLQQRNIDVFAYLDDSE